MTEPKHPKGTECECKEPCWVPSDDWCKDHLMEPTWVEGFTCTKPKGHAGPHEHASTHQEDLSGTDEFGRPYHWTHTWSYD